MTPKKKKRRKGGPHLTAEQHHMNLAMALMRADVAVEDLNASDDAFPKAKRDQFLQLKHELMTQQVGPSGRWFSHLLMYFATVHVIIRTWQRGPFHNAQVKELLNDTKMVGMLTDFRDDLVHGGPLLGEDVSIFFDHITEVNPWALKLRQACEAQVVTFFASPRAIGSNTLRDPTEKT